jgi:hypothetical protein
MLSQKTKKLSGLGAEWGCGAVELRRRHIQPNQWVALL